ncbi:MAG TPA: GFA family protein [Mesorhizobium sp.]
MSLDNRPHYSGGCQCGAVRFSVDGALGEASICHCRMCQKAAGNFYLPLVSVGEGKLEWTRGQPKRFQSSNAAKRGFCESCGTPLTYEGPDGVAISIGAFDHPEEIAPVVQWGTEHKLPYVDAVSRLPGHETLEDEAAASFLRELVSYQHPDHDTETWPPRLARRTDHE